MLGLPFHNTKAVHNQANCHLPLGCRRRFVSISHPSQLLVICPITKILIKTVELACSLFKFCLLTKKTLDLRNDGPRMEWKPERERGLNGRHCSRNRLFTPAAATSSQSLWAPGGPETTERRARRRWLNGTIVWAVPWRFMTNRTGSECEND